MRLPESRRRRVAFCLGLAVLSPFVTAGVTTCAMTFVVPALFGYGPWDYEAWRVLRWIGAAVGGAGSAVAVLALPTRHGVRVASAVGAFLAVLWT